MTNGSGGITPIGGLGMLWYPVKQFGDFRVKLQFREGRTDGQGSSNGGVFLRFPDPRVPLAQRPDSCSRQGSAATDQAWVAIYCGHEFQMFDGDRARAASRRRRARSTTSSRTRSTRSAKRRPKGEWEDYEIEAVGQTFKIYRNGELINTFDNTPGKASSRGGDPDTSQRQFTRGLHRPAEPRRRDTTQYRNIRVRGPHAGCRDRRPDRVVHGRGRRPAHGRVPLDRRGRQRRGAQDGRRSRSVALRRRARRAATPLPSPPTSTILPADDRHARRRSASARCRPRSRGRRSTAAASRSRWPARAR